MPKILVSLLCFNTCNATEGVLRKFPQDDSYDVIVVNDGSTDGTAALLRNSSRFKIIEHQYNKGLGAAIKTSAKFALDNHYDILVIMAGNGKDNPEEIPKIFRPITEGEADYVQGSRFLRGGSSDNLPLFRLVMIKAYALFLSVITRQRVTDPLNGFRAYRLDILKDPRINVWQDWLDHYEYETYLNLNVLRFGFKYKEVAVSKLYPAKKKKIKYTHIRPFIDWWSILKPILFLYLGIKK
ncbi:MAG: glycosyltransferase family 2 protein [Candidatus Omnitrophica bacterium]|nr:glycosyltransferase family 2 protein [Candidatus Omnitrophota bacterium]MDD5553397.1 glycosyltransferase family 2 protein [Candidatus Omnitrophota bacterium]